METAFNGVREEADVVDGALTALLVIEFFIIEDEVNGLFVDIGVAQSEADFIGVFIGVLESLAVEEPKAAFGFWLTVFSIFIVVVITIMFKVCNRMRKFIRRRIFKPTDKLLVTRKSERYP